MDYKGQLVDHKGQYVCNTFELVTSAYSNFVLYHAYKRCSYWPEVDLDYSYNCYI